MANKYKQKKKKIFKTYGKSNKELNVLIGIRKFIENKKRRRRNKRFSTFKKCKILMMKVKRVSLAWHIAWIVEKSSLLVPNEN